MLKCLGSTLSYFDQDNVEEIFTQFWKLQVDIK